MTEESIEDLVIYEHTSEHVARITLNRPAKLNTITPAMGVRVAELVRQVNDDDAVRVVVLTGTGPKSFCAGSDVSALDQYGTSWQLRNRVDYARAIGNVRKPVIAAIDGYAFGGGLELALFSDIRLATPTSTFCAAEIKLGWHGGAGATQLLPRIIGYGNALQLLLTGDRLSAAEACAMGLVQRVVEPEVLLSEADALAARIAANAPIAAQYAKHLVRVSMSTSLEIGLGYENDTFVYEHGTQDAAEGRAAFAERRPPQFTGE
ncbi:enoyl-CoA hydratase/isomerase family protein [Nakamurella antarctica]|uniref:Enoyl-CoA hydratase/isomerase family protein n=1 Tax=Nakamurella antarctica TaxID=1902245 RepID=A0A3G8ZM59_9ACTN|nr:enoyl-CoA hydratase/isomerase family protein [Nakamurella antarctica]AZI58439.1 enoyl-CoA hydratase/isomerase family protein [Nakamurella antarctica]